MVNALKSRACSVFIALSVLFTVTSGHFFSVPVNATATAVLSISPSSRPLAAPGSTITYDVNVSNISPDHSLAGWSIYVQTNNAVLSPVSFAVVSFPGGGFESAHCVNNLGTGCDAIDAFAPGTVHSEFALFGNPVSGNFTLFTITYQAVAGPYSQVTFLRSGDKTQLFDRTGLPISFTESIGSYGTVPVLPVASFAWTPLNPFQGDNVTFDARSSLDPSGRPLVLYSWVFAPINSGSAPIEATGVIVNKIFDAGYWTATLTVKNDLGVSSASTVHAFYVAVKPSRDLAVLIVSYIISPILPGSTQTIFVLVKNVGTTTEIHFNVSFSVPGQVFRPPPYPYPLFPNKEALFTFSWNTTGVEPGTYKLHAHIDPLLNEKGMINETNISNNDDFLPVTFVPYLLFTPSSNDPLMPSGHRHEIIGNLTLESGAGFTGTINLTASSIGPLQPFGSPSALSIRFDQSSIELTPNSFASTTINIGFGKNTAPGDYIVTVFASSGSFKLSSFFPVTVPSDDVRMPHLSWNQELSLLNSQTWEATVVNTLPTPTNVDLFIFASTSQSSCEAFSSVVVAAESTARLTLSCRPFEGFQLGQSWKFVATLGFSGVNGFEFLSSDVRTGTFTIVS